MAGVRLVIDVDIDELAALLDCVYASQWLPAGVQRPPAELRQELFTRLAALMSIAQARPDAPEFPTVPGEL